MACNAGILLKSGAWFSYEGERIAQGRDNARLYLDQHPDVLEEIENKTRAHYGLKPLTPAAPEAEPAEDKRPKKTSKRQAEDVEIID